MYSFILHIFIDRGKGQVLALWKHKMVVIVNWPIASDVVMTDCDHHRKISSHVTVVLHLIALVKKIV